jgi:cytochrome c-type biogenesis protein CcmH
MTAKIALVLILTGLVVGSTVGTTVAQESLGADNLAIIGTPQGNPISGAELDRATEELTDRMRCPVCQGLSIADSGTMIALAMKEEVRQFLAAGYTEEQILLYFEASYGEFIRLEPKPTGFNLLVWIAPLAVLLLGAGVVFYRLRSKPAGQAASAAVGSAEKENDDLESYRERVRREVAS